ncbi:MAG TPA: hypothetical protein VGD23_06170 [Sphingomicrobium sp.]
MAGFVLILSIHLAVWAGLGFLIAVFSTNPPPRVAGYENMVAFGRYCLFGVMSFIIGLACYRHIQRFDRSIEK